MRGRLMFALVACVAARPAMAAQPADATPVAPPVATPVVPDDAPPPPDGPPADPGLPTDPLGPIMGPDDGPSSGDEPASPSAGPPLPHEDNDFGPVVQIEGIDITGNTATQAEVIRRALRLKVGDVLHSTDKRLRDARYKVLALGFFRDVTMAVRKGSQRGQVVVEVKVVERGTITLNRLWFGTTALTPAWAGLDVGERNLFGTGIAVGGGFVYAHQSEAVPGGRDQWAGELRVAEPSVHGTPWGVSAAALFVHGSEPFRISGAPDDNNPGSQQAFPYNRMGLRFGATYAVSALTTLSVGARAEAISDRLPEAPTRRFTDGHVATINLHLLPGDSRVDTASFAFDRDTRPDPILPHAGSHLLLSAELGGAVLGGDYNFATLFGRYEHYWPILPRHALAIKLAGGVVIGDADRFDRIHIADVDRMLTPRALGLVLSTAAPINFLGTKGDKPVYGDLGGSATLEYAINLFRGKGAYRFYGADVFFGGGLWGLAEQGDLRARDAGVVGSIPIDLYLDAGLRLDTDIGTFEITIGNALGRLR
ncbi:MAG TPA: BamA/TamA family outer membrane protein [Kofleriaceae bacterium]|nr:BamA/TamA family outer membrane protein [Kofleriaceae bacterium]